MGPTIVFCGTNRLTGAFIDTFADLTGFGHLGPVGVAFGFDGKLYVSTFDDDRVVQLDGTTGAVLNSTSGPPGLGFGPVVLGPDGNLYVVALNLSSFAGSVYRYDPATHLVLSLSRKAPAVWPAPAGSRLRQRDLCWFPVSWRM